VTLDPIVIAINMGLFLHSIPTVSSIEVYTLGVISFGEDTVKYAANFRKTAVT